MSLTRDNLAEAKAALAGIIAALIKPDFDQIMEDFNSIVVPGPPARSEGPNRHDRRCADALARKVRA